MDAHFCKTGTIEKLVNSIEQPFVYSARECDRLEAYVRDVINLGSVGCYQHHSIDRTLLRTKYFFGERYTYGAQMSEKRLGLERLYPSNLIEPIPLWIYLYIINPLISANVIEANFVNSAVINEYLPGGCIVSHIDPPHIFDRPIISISLFSDCAMCFGCKFEYKPIRCSEPILRLPLPRGVVTLLSGFAANEITHCIRPEDTTFYRAVILLRRVLPNAPRLSHLSTLLDANNVNLVAASKFKLDNDKTTEGVLKKFCDKYSKVRKGKRGNYGGIMKVHTRKTYFADNKQYANKAYSISE
ncbi:hypothetical protein PPYR_13509 [Photinus pyralis]|uniref:RNA demethylase ALKBH5 n=1 Tax=Photinus pyralis TaxID=7054 RepID=A0A1Y1M307_PHOPY|nr:RNA demethylase ALKBH5-like [Photinus pyralis]KAB0793889.1 hypothetical protein PPYR_13509 [Photinus pyralis]